MGLKTVLDSLDGVPEEHHDLYAEKDDKFVLQLEGVDEHPSVIALRNGHRNSKKERQEALDKLKEAEDKIAGLPEDFDADEWARLKSEAEAREDDPDGKDVRKQVEAATTAVKDQYEAKLKKQRETLESEISELKNENAVHVNWKRETLIDNAVHSLLEQGGVKDPGLREGAALRIKRDLELVEEDGKAEVRAKSDLGGDPAEVYIKNLLQTDTYKPYVQAADGPEASGGKQKGGAPAKNAGDLGGPREKRVEAIKARFPDLKAG